MNPDIRTTSDFICENSELFLPSTTVPSDIDNIPKVKNENDVVLSYTSYSCTSYDESCVNDPGSNKKTHPIPVDSHNLQHFSSNSSHVPKSSKHEKLNSNEFAIAVNNKIKYADIQKLIITLELKGNFVPT